MDGSAVERLEQRLSDLHSEVVKIRVELAELNGMLPSVAHRLSRVERELWGDGQAGLAARVTAILWLLSGVAGLLMVVIGQTVASWLRAVGG